MDGADVPGIAIRREVFTSLLLLARSFLMVGFDTGNVVDSVDMGVIDVEAELKEEDDVTKLGADVTEVEGDVTGVRSKEGPRSRVRVGESSVAP